MGESVTAVTRMDNTAGRISARWSVRGLSPAPPMSSVEALLRATSSLLEVSTNRRNTEEAG